MPEFEDKVALVTGASTGIGRAIALEFAAKGASIVVADVNDQEAQETVKLIEKEGSQAAFVHANVSQPLDAEDMVAETIKCYGRLDFACNNAGIEGVSVPLVEMDPTNWQQVIDVNLTGVFLSMKFELGEMLKAGSGAIVNIASILGQVGFSAASAYVASKHGVVGLTKAGALDYAKQGIRVNAVCPGFTVSPMLDRIGFLGDPDRRKFLEKLHPMGHLGEPYNIAKAVTWLCSDDAAFITGEALLVDGGYAAR